MNLLVELLPSKGQPIWVRYGLTALIVLAFAGVLVLAERETAVLSLFILLPAVFISALAFDRGTGFFATALCLALILGYLKFLHGSLLPEQYWLVCVLFVLIAVALATVSEALRNALEKSLEAERVKQLYYEELEHRITNDLALVSASLSLQATGHDDQRVKDALKVAVNRVQAIAKAHKQLHQGLASPSVAMADCLEELCFHLRASNSDKDVKLTTSCEPIVLETRKAVSVGLIVNELVTNSFRHGFLRRERGQIDVTMVRGADLELIVEDNGDGCPAGLSPGLGSRLIAALVAQLSGTYLRSEMSPGCRVSVKFPAIRQNWAEASRR